MDAYSILMVAYLGILSVAGVAFTVLRLRYPPIPPMTADEAHREFVARRYRDL